MKRLGFLIILLVATLIVVGCNSDKEGTVDESNVKDEDGSEENTDVDEIKNKDGYMKIGETGHVWNELGEFELTPTDVQIFKEKDEVTPMNDDEVFVLIDYTVKNIGEHSLEEDDVLAHGIHLENSQEDRAFEDRYYEYDFVNGITEDIEPGETAEGQMIFAPPESETSEYILHLSSSLGDTEDSNWLFTESEAN